MNREAKVFEKPVVDWGLRTLVPEDVLEIEKIEKSAYPCPWSAEAISGELKRPQAINVGITLNNALIGYALTYFVVDELHILNLAVSPQFQRQGYGRTLLAEVLNRARTRKGEVAVLEVRRGNAQALRLYEQFGFQFVGVRLGYYRDNGEDAFVLECRLGTGNSASSTTDTHRR